MFTEARLDIALKYDAGLIQRVEVLSTRQTNAADFFVNRQPQDVIRILPTVFSLCGTAQAMAGLSALQSAMGLPIDPQLQTARHLLVTAESIAESGMALCRDWPDLLDLPPHIIEARQMKVFQSAIRAALFPDGQWNNLTARPQSADTAAIRAAITDLQRHLFSVLGADLSAVLADLPSWAETSQTPIAQVMRQCLDLTSARFGDAAFAPMPPDGAIAALHRMGQDHGASYCRIPDLHGQHPETGPLARRAAHPLIRQFLRTHGSGIATRMVARLVDIQQSLLQLQDGITPDLPFGAVEAARGLLLHRAEVKNGLVTRYQILAPTEWNFHPHGVLRRSLEKTALDSHLHRNMLLLIHALDPCVAASFTVDHIYA